MEARATRDQCFLFAHAIEPERSLTRLTAFWRLAISLVPFSRAIVRAPALLLS